MFLKFEFQKFRILETLNFHPCICDKYPNLMNKLNYILAHGAMVNFYALLFIYLMAIL